MNDPIDRFFVSNVDAFLNRPFDHLVVDPNNSKLIDNHLASLIEETSGRLHESDRAILGEAFYNAANKDGGQPIKGWRPQPYLNLRGSIGRSYKLKRGNEELGQISEMRRFREAYLGAIFTFFGRKYRVHAHEADAVVLKDAEPNLRSDASFYTVLHQNQIHDGLTYGGSQIFHGTLNFQMNFSGYKLVEEGSEEVRDVVSSRDALYQNNLHAVWFNLMTDDVNETGVGALENLFRVGAMFVIPADRFDTSTSAKLKDGLTVYYYENYEGGIGVARKFYEVWPDVLRKGIKIAADCPCEAAVRTALSQLNPGAPAIWILTSGPALNWGKSCWVAPGQTTNSATDAWYHCNRQAPSGAARITLTTKPVLLFRTYRVTIQSDLIPYHLEKISCSKLPLSALGASALPANSSRIF